MKLSKYAKLVKNEGYCNVVHVAGSGIWLGTQSAIYRATELPDMEGEAINALAFSGMKIAEAARLAGVSQSGFIGRIERIEDKTGLNPLDFFDLQDLYEIAGA